MKKLAPVWLFVLAVVFLVLGSVFGADLPAPASQGGTVQASPGSVPGDPGADWVTVLGFLASLVSVVAGAIAKYKHGQAASLESQLVAVIRGVESASSVLPEGNQIKRTIATVAGVVGVKDQLHATVKRVTED